jgi:hypothetical protein
MGILGTFADKELAIFLGHLRDAQSPLDQTVFL